MVFLRIFFAKVKVWKKQQITKSMQNYPACKELSLSGMQHTEVFLHFGRAYMGLNMRKPVFGGGGGGGREGTTQAHLGSLISAFFIYVLEGNISKLATSEISIFYLVSVAEQAGLNLTLSVNRKTGFVATRPI